MLMPTLFVGVQQGLAIQKQFYLGSFFFFFNILMVTVGQWWQNVLTMHLAWCSLCALEGQPILSELEGN